MSILLSGPKTSALTDLVNRLFDVCPSLNLLHRDTEDLNRINRIEDRGLHTVMAPSVEQCMESINTVINLNYYSSPGDFNDTIYSFMLFADSFVPQLRKNRGIWVNLVPELDNRKVDSVLSRAMSELIAKYSEEEERRYRTGEYVSFINIRLVNGCKRFSAEQTCLLVDYLSKYRDILVNMPGKELRLF